MIRALALAAFLLAALLGGQGLWIPVKAALAQLLLADAWRRAAAGEAEARPWPWADTWPVARIEVPRLELERIVLAGASGATLAFGPGWMDGTAMPGETGNAIVAGHRDTSFRFLGELRAGDVILVERAGGEVATYRVEETRVVDAADPWSFEPSEEPVLTLATCWPIDAPVLGGRLRYVVRARAVSEVPSPVPFATETKRVHRRALDRAFRARTRRSRALPLRELETSARPGESPEDAS